MKPHEKPTGRLPEIIENSGGEGLYCGTLVPYFGPILRSRGAGNQYHNFRHIFEVTFKCYGALEYYRSAGKQIDPVKGRSLMIAAMFHDFDHPGRSGNDDLNIQFALRGLEKHIMPEDRPMLKDISVLIRTTEFGTNGQVHPVGSLGTDIEELERVIRDADVSQCFGFAWIQLICFGLGNEIGIGAEKMLRSQPAYLRLLKMESEWGQKTYPQETIEAKIAECEGLIRILDASQR